MGWHVVKINVKGLLKSGLRFQLLGPPSNDCVLYVNESVYRLFINCYTKNKYFYFILFFLFNFVWNRDTSMRVSWKVHVLLMTFWLMWSLTTSERNVWTRGRDYKNKPYLVTFMAIFIDHLGQIPWKYLGQSMNLSADTLIGLSAWALSNLSWACI